MADLQKAPNADPNNPAILGQTSAAMAPVPSPAPPPAPGAIQAPPPPPPQAPPPQGTPAAPPPAAGTRSVWKDLVQGALWGLAGSAGQKHFGGGLGAGAKGAQEGVAEQQQLHFESAEAAQKLALATQQLKTGDLVNKDTQLKIDQLYRDARETALERGEPDPYPISGGTNQEMSSQGLGAINTIKNNNNGLIPPVSVTQSPAGVGEKADQHQADAYTVTLGDIRNNPDKVLPSLNRGQVMAGDRPFATMQDALAYGNTQMPGKGAVWVAQHANNSYSATHSVDFKPTPDEQQVVSDTLSQQIERIKKNGTDSNGELTPDAQDTIKLLTDQKNISDAHIKELASAKGGAITKQQLSDSTNVVNSYTALPEPLRKGYVQELNDATNLTQLQDIEKRADASEQSFQRSGDARTQADATRDVETIKAMAPQLDKADEDQAQTLSQIQATRSSLDLSQQQGNQTATEAAKVQFAQLILSQGGTKRLSPVALKMLGGGVSWIRQAEDIGAGGTLGKLPDITYGDMRKMLDAMEDSANYKHDADVASIRKNYGAALPENQRQQNAPPSSHVFDSAAWQAANPNGNLGAAQAEARKQGYDVK